MKNPVVHFEIAGQDGPALEKFYGTLLDWRINRQDMGDYQYAYVDTGKEGLTGGIRHEPEGHAEVVLYVEVDDLDAAVASASQLGAGVRIPPMEAGGVTFALITDPAGNPLGLVQKGPESDPGG